MTLATASAMGVPSNGPLFIMAPSVCEGQASVNAPVAPSGPEMTRTTSRPKRWANSKSRGSWPGTAMMAPVP